MSHDPTALIKKVEDGTFAQDDAVNLIRIAATMLKEADTKLADVAKLLSGGPQLSKSVVWEILNPDHVPISKYTPQQLVDELTTALTNAGHEVDERRFAEQADDIASCVIIALHEKHLITDVRISTDDPKLHKLEERELGHFTAVLGPPLVLSFQRRRDGEHIEFLRSSKTDHLQFVKTLMAGKTYRMGRVDQKLVIREASVFKDGG